MSRKRLRAGVVALMLGLAWWLPDAGVASAAGTARPIGSVDTGVLSGVTYSVSGWAFDPDTANRPISVDVWDFRPDGSATGVRVTAAGSRPDVGQVFPGAGSAHGFAASLTLSVAGAHQVCAFAIDSELPDLNTLIGCRSVTVSGPIGSLDTVRMIVPNRLSVEGWAAQPGAPDRDTELRVRVTAPDGSVSTYAGIMTEVIRDDVRNVFGWTSGRTGFGTEIPINQTGRHTVCVSAVGTDQGVTSPITPSISLLGCPVVDVQNTFGSFDDLTWAAGSLRVRGWALNPNRTTVPTEIHVYDYGPSGVVGRSGLFTGTARPDVVAVYPGLGTAPGFDLTLPTSGSGKHTVCVFGITAGGGTGNTLIGCRDVTVG